MKPPVSMAVNNTPPVANNTPGKNTGRISEKRVSIPPENKITLSAITPMYWAVWGELKSRRPKASEPATHPISKNNKRVGTPYLYPVLPITKLKNKRSEDMSKKNSIDNSMFYLNVCI
jgi:hypothetical protein